MKEQLESWRGKRVLLYTNAPATVNFVGTLSAFNISKSGIAVALTNITPQRETRVMPDMLCYLHKPEFGSLTLVTDPQDDPSQTQS